MRDAWLFGLLVTAFASLVTTHVAIVGRLLARSPRHRALLALVLPPLAPYFAWTNGWRRTAWMWGGTAGAYAILLALAQA